MYIINVALITAIIFSFILSLFSIMLMLSSVEKKKNFLFSENFALQVNGNDLTKISSGLIFGGSIFLGTLLIWLWYKYNYSKWELGGRNKVLNYQYNRDHISKALEWVIIVAILFLIIGVAIFSYDLFDKMMDYQLETIESVSLWVIFALGIITFALALGVILYLTIEERKPIIKKDEVENENKDDEDEANKIKIKVRAQYEDKMREDWRRVRGNKCKFFLEYFKNEGETPNINNNWKNYINEQYPYCNEEDKNKLIRILSAKYPDIRNGIIALNNLLNVVNPYYM